MSESGGPAELPSYAVKRKGTPSGISREMASPIVMVSGRFKVLVIDDSPPSRRGP